VAERGVGALFWVQELLEITPNDRPQATSRFDGVGVDVCMDDPSRGSIRGTWLSVGTGQDMDTSWAVSWGLTAAIHLRHE
jgi:hypothetical protein